MSVTLFLPCHVSSFIRSNFPNCTVIFHTHLNGQKSCSRLNSCRANKKRRKTSLKYPTQVYYADLHRSKRATNRTLKNREVQSSEICKPLERGMVREKEHSASSGGPALCDDLSLYYGLIFVWMGNEDSKSILKSNKEITSSKRVWLSPEAAEQWATNNNKTIFISLNKLQCEPEIWKLPR